MKESRATRIVTPCGFHVHISESQIARVEGIAAKQFGVFTREQAAASGLSPRVLQRLVDTSRWQRVLPRVYRVSAVAASFRQRAMAVSLWAEPDGLVSHFTAARLWKLDGITSNDLHVSLPRTRKLRHDTVTVHSSREFLPADRAVIHSIATTSALRTVLDIAAGLDPLTLEIAIEDGLRRRLFSVGQLRWRTGERCGPGVPGSALVGALLQQHGLGTTDSGWELRVARILTAGGLPEPVRQLPLMTIDGERTVDLAYPGPPVVAFEYDSDRWHSGVRQRHHDAARRNALRLAGATVIEVTSSLVASPERLLEAARAALASPMHHMGS